MMITDKKTTIFRARSLRKRMTKAEQLLWRFLRNCRLNGCRFRKQAPLSKYIVDFVCHDSRLIIELDGGQHNTSGVIRYDQERATWLENQGYFVQRFWNN